MKYAIVMDSVGSLPDSEFVKRPIKLLPLAVSFDGIEYVDTYEERALVPIHSAGRVGIKTDSVSITPSAKDVASYLLKNIVSEYDVIICQSVGRDYTPIYDSMVGATDSLEATSKAIRLSAGRTEELKTVCVDSYTVVAGQGLIALHSDNILREGMPLDEFVDYMGDFRTLVKTFLIVRDSVYARHRQKQKGNKTVSYPMAVVANTFSVAPITLAQNSQIDVMDLTTRGFDNAVEKVLDYCCERVQEGLAAPLINLSYAGDPLVLTKHNSFKKLQHVCDVADVRLYIGAMTLAASINTGPGVLTVGIAPINQDATP
ncbi:MAG: DegV family protein [Pseudomonadota bacterium]